MGWLKYTRAAGVWTALALFAFAPVRAGLAQTTEVEVVYTAIQVDPFEPLPFQSTSLLNIAEPDVLGHLELSTGLFTHRAADLMLLVSEGDVVSRAIGQQHRLEALVALGFFGFTDVGVAVPGVVDQQSDDLGFAGRSGTRLTGVALGDVRAHARIRLLDPTKGPGLGLAVMGTAYIPTGDTATFNSDGTLRWEARLALGWYHRTGLGLSVNASRQWRPARQVHDYISDDMWRWGVGMRIPTAVERLTVMATASGTALANETVFFETRDQYGERPVEVSAAAELRLPGEFFLLVGAGKGMSRGVGAPSYRGFASVNFLGAGPRRAVRRNDWVAEKDDVGPEQELALARVEEEAPLPPELEPALADVTEDPFVDTVEDVVVVGAEPEPAFPVVSLDEERGLVIPTGEVESSPPLRPDQETIDEFVLPVPATADADFDGIPDATDRCPQQAEDVDGFEDEDGCRDDDHDKDGVDDLIDPCPGEGEDLDGYQDDDGCPDPDNDADGIPDTEDDCPGEPETINGFQDDDGCPDVEPRVRVSQGHILVDGDIEFVAGKATLQRRSRGILDSVAEFLREHPEIERVRIEGYTDSSGGFDANQRLSQQRAEAVWDYLVMKGVHPTRLVATGYGELYPTEKNRSRRGRAANRRVELRILRENRGGTH